MVIRTVHGHSRMRGIYVNIGFSCMAEIASQRSPRAKESSFLAACVKLPNKPGH